MGNVSRLCTNKQKLVILLIIWATTMQSQHHHLWSSTVFSNQHSRLMWTICNTLFAWMAEREGGRERDHSSASTGREKRTHLRTHQFIYSALVPWHRRIEQTALKNQKLVLWDGSTKSNTILHIRGQIYGRIIHITGQIERMNYGYKMRSS